MKHQQELWFEVEDQIGADAIHDDHPIVSEFREIVGDHTFFLDERGLCIVVPVEIGAPRTGNMVKVASWAADHSHLYIHEREIMPVILDLGLDDTGSAG